jgi:hypothetical protein
LNPVTSASSFACRFWSRRSGALCALDVSGVGFAEECAHAPMVADLVTAVNRVQQQLKDITADEPKASSAVRDMAKEVQHLQVAETWVSATERVLMAAVRAGGHRVSMPCVVHCMACEFLRGMVVALITMGVALYLVLVVGGLATAAAVSGVLRGIRLI